MKYMGNFLISKKSKISAFEVKSPGTGKHESIKEFAKKFSANIDGVYLLSGKDVGAEKTLKKKPLYMTPFIIS